MSLQHEEVVALGKTPISDSSPVGDPVRYDESFEELQGQLDRLNSITGEQVDWNRVVALSTDILKNKSKDMLVMTYLALGLFEVHGYAGLRAGIEAYTEFIKTFWAACFPKVKPPQGRYNAVQYLLDKIMVQIELKGGQCKRMPAANEKEAVHQCVDKFDAFADAIDAPFKELPDAPNPMPLKRAFKALREKVGPLVTEKPVEVGGEPDAEGGAPAAPRPAAAAAAPVPDSFATPSAAVQVAVRAAKYFFGQDNKDPRGYGIMRAAHFGSLLESPKSGVIPPPVPPQRRQFFETTAASANWAELLTQAEGQFATTPLWLDLQRYVGLALKGLGATHAAALHTVVLETLSLTLRLPEILDLNFKDGTASADGATKAWLDEMRGQYGTGGGGGGGGGRAKGDALADALTEARKLLAQSKQAEALSRLARAADGAASRRQQFRAQLAMADFCSDMNKPNLAQAILEGLEAIVDQYRVADWEPELASDLYRALFECMRKNKPKPTTPEDVVRQSDVFARLCRLNPAAALQIDGIAKKS